MAVNSAELLSTRLFPKHQGASAVVLTGLAARCDWVITSDTEPPQVELRRLCGLAAPRTIFLSLREPFAALEFFATVVLPELSAPFVLISGSEDITLPLQCDCRWRCFTAAEERWLLQIATHPLLRCWYVENLDWPFAAKVKPLPLGVLPPTAPGDQEALLQPSSPPLPVQERELLVLCAHRHRQGPQWRERAELSKQLQALGHPWLIVVDEELAARQYVELLRRVSFVICAPGGGWDPCPKLWHALWHGAIPIVRSGALDPWLSAWPVWVVQAWGELEWSQQALEGQRGAILQRSPPPHRWRHQLELSPWWQAISID